MWMHACLALTPRLLLKGDVPSCLFVMLLAVQLTNDIGKEQWSLSILQGYLYH